MFEKVQKHDIFEGIKAFEEKGLPNGFGPSTSYNLIYQDKTYPPKAVMAYARHFATGELIVNDFIGGAETECFSTLEKFGFDVRHKDVINDLIRDFLNQAKTNNLKTKHYLNNYEGLKVKVSFGAGNSAKIPWISFLNETNTTSKGIYPVYLYYKEYNLLILAYGTSETDMPEKNWDLSDEKTIREYFKENFNTEPARYGDSHVYSSYKVDDLPDSKIINDDLIKIIHKYKSLFNNKISSKKKYNNVEFDNSIFQEAVNDSGLIFSDLLIKRFIASLWTKPFIICSGLSGSGKTKLAQAFAMWICQDKSQYEIVPVGADWTNREPLLGYPNALNNTEYVTPESGVLQLILRAKQNESLPFFLILDEMNLSHVERYFADFLSTMESGEEIALHDIENGNIDIPKKLKIPKNLFIIGTVNIDETTYMFSPKVLDRANTIEFRLTEKNIEDFINSNNPLDLSKLEFKGAAMGVDFARIASETREDGLNDYKTKILEFFGELKKSGAEFGYRTTAEMGQLIAYLAELGIKDNALLDVAIMQKLLPKLHGSRTKLSKTLITLGGFCLKDSKDIKENYFTPFTNNNLSEEYLNQDENVLYKLSFEKICRMYKNAVENGFASYAEA